jgi:Uma2 family endonuclease
MPRVDLDPIAFRRMVRRRRRWGADRHDEVWDGVYVMSPEADNEHQELGLDLASTIKQAIRDQFPRVRVLPSCNITDQDERWRRNFRCPDAAVFLPGNSAQDRKTHWFGGPDFAIEILSSHDRSREKYAFYARVGVRELMIVDRAPWQLELHRRVDDAWMITGRSDLPESVMIQSSVLPLGFRLLTGDPRPLIEVIRPADGQTWLV